MPVFGKILIRRSRCPTRVQHRPERASAGTLPPLTTHLRLIPAILHLPFLKMKQRRTYLLPSGSNLHVNDLAVTSDSLTFAKAQNAVEEWKFTLGMEELPDEVFLTIESN